MPFLKGRARTKRIEPSTCTETDNTLGEKDNDKRKDREKMPPFLSTLKFQLKDLEVDVLKRTDDLEEGIEFTSLPAHETVRVQSITLPMDMPVVGCDKLGFRRRQGEFCNPTDVTNRLCMKRSMVSCGSDMNGTAVTETAVKISSDENQPTAGKWFNDIDKLSSLKNKQSVEISSKQKDQTLKEWAASPKKFYKCILKHRQKKIPHNRFPLFTCEELITRELKPIANSRKVSFPPEILLFSAIEENMASEVKDVIRTHKIDVNRCQNSRGLTPLHRAVQLGAVDCVRILISSEADVNIKDSRDLPALDLAMRTRQFECVVLLVEAGADIAEYTKQRLLEFENAQMLSKSCYRSFEVSV